MEDATDRIGFGDPDGAAGWRQLRRSPRTNCRNTGNFDRWLADFKKEAAGPGHLASGHQRRLALPGPRPAHHQHRPRAALLRAELPRILRQDAARPTGCQTGAAKIKKYQRDLRARGEGIRRAGRRSSPAFWGLESDFGAGQGKDQAIKSLTTLAYDCRRSDMFRGHLFDALRMIERGDLRAGGDDRLLGGRARPDPDDAVGILSRTRSTTTATARAT